MIPRSAPDAFTDTADMNAAMAELAEQLAPGGVHRPHEAAGGWT